MNIDPRIEEHVREAYRAVIAKDGDRMVRAFRGLGEVEAATMAAYGVFVCGYVVNDVLRDGVTEGRLRDLATKIVHSESDWIDLGSAEAVAHLLGAASRGDTSFAGVPREDVIGSIFVCGGYLLGVYRSEGKEWWDYLDVIWEELLASPEPT